MTFGLKHPNLSNLLQKLMPGSEKNAALETAVDVSSQINLKDNVYTLTALKGSFGPITLGGNITADMSGSKPNISGTLKTGKLP